MRHYHLPASVENCHWGWFAADLEPRLTIASGDSVTVETVSGAEDVLPGPGFHIPPALTEIHANAERMVPGHILTGPIAIEDAEPGDVVEVVIEQIDLFQDWGYNMSRPLVGTLPEEFQSRHQVNIPLDASRMTGRLPWGLELSLEPFFGVMGTAPPPHWGRLTSLVPRQFGGNLDLKELVKGARLFLPVFVPGALFSCGDGHGCQGDGEVNVTAIETALRGTLTFHLHKDMALAWPRAETPSHMITLGIGPDLDRCAEDALRAMIDWIVTRRGLSREEAYMLCSLAADLRITQTVNQNKGVHCMLKSELLAV